MLTSLEYFTSSYSLEHAIIEFYVSLNCARVSSNEDM